MKVGQTVYTVNNTTNKVDSWTYAGTLPAKDEFLIHLVNGKRETFLPVRCVFTSKAKALEVAKL